MSRQATINYNKNVHLNTNAYRQPDTLKINTGNTIEHETVKAMCVYILKKKGYEVYTEADWGNGWKGRADIYVPEIPCYIEVLQSETNAMLKKKCASYPDIAQMVVRVSEVTNKVTKGGDITWVINYAKLEERLP